MRAGIRSFIAIAGLTASATLTLFAGNAFALGAGACNAYADRAVAQGRLAQAKKCGFGVSETGNIEHPGPAWSIDRNAYVRECRKWTSEDTPNERNAARDKELNKCGYCAAYAARTANRGREAVRFSCDFSFPSQFYQPNFEFCMARYGASGEPGLSEIYAYDEQRDAEHLRVCKEQFSSEQIALCQNYADKASEQATWNFHNKCGNAKGGGAGRWTWNADHHFEFCTAGLERARAGGGDEAAIKASMKAEEEARDEVNKMCVPNMIRKRPTPEMTTMDPSALEKKRDLDRAGKSRQRSDRAKAAAQPAEVAVPRSKSTAPVSNATPNAMDRLGAGPASGGSYKSKDGTPTQTRSSGGGGTQSGSSSAGELPNLRTMPANTGSMTSGGSTPAWKGSTR